MLYALLYCVFSFFFLPYYTVAQFSTVCFVLMIPLRLCALVLLRHVCAERLTRPSLCAELRGLWLADLHYQPGLNNVLDALPT